MRNAWFAVTLAVALGLPSAVRAQGDHVGAEQPIDAAWLTADTTANTATFELIAGLTGMNGALNFNGFRDGGAHPDRAARLVQRDALPQSRRHAPPLGRCHPRRHP